ICVSTNPPANTRSIRACCRWASRYWQGPMRSNSPGRTCGGWSGELGPRGRSPGSRLSMLTSSMGRAYLAVQEPDQRAALLEELGAAAVKNGEDGVRLVKAAQVAIDDYARDGCCYSFRDWHADVNAIAAPLRDVRNGRWLVLSTRGPASSMDGTYFPN